MKTKLIIWATLCLLCMVSCSKNDDPQPSPVPAKQPDSIYVYKLKADSSFKYLDTYYYQYDAAGNQTEKIEGDYKYVRNFDANGNVLEEIVYTLSDIPYGWHIDHKLIYAYNNQNQAISMKWYDAKYEEDDWRTYPFISEEYTYSDDGMTQYILSAHIFMAYLPNLVIADTLWHKGIVKKNAHGDIVELCDSTQARVDSVTWSEWKLLLYEKSEYEYDTYGNITYEYINQTNHGFEKDKCTYEYTYTYEYDEEGTILTRVEKCHESQWISSSTSSSNTDFTRKYVYYY